MQEEPPAQQLAEPPAQPPAQPPKRRGNSKSTCYEIRTSQDERTVRAVHGEANGKKQLWLYVPEHGSD